MSVSVAEQQCLVIEINRGTTHDGPGIRTTVFLKGCPLNCRWCQNPEGIKAGQEIWWEERRCIRCLACQQACPEGAVLEDEHELHIDLARCTLCGACVEACPSLAMSYAGKAWTLEQLLHEVLKDRAYYESFGGGVTVSGGEPLQHSAFVAELFQRLQAEGVHTALDTCGMASREALDAVLPHSDQVLYDIKLMDPDAHQQYTGQSNMLILNNLLHAADYIRKVNAAGEHEMRLWIRTPLIPETTATEENLAAIADFLRENLLDVVERWELCAFNNLCRTKYEKMGRTWAYADCPLMNQPTIDRIKAVVLAAGFPEDRLVVSGLVATGG